MSMEFVMNNDELAQAIEKTYAMLDADIFDEPLRKTIVKHFKYLLKVQKYRSDVMSDFQD